MLFNPCNYCANFNPILELKILLEISIKEAKAEMETHTVTAKSKTRKCLSLQIFPFFFHIIIFFYHIIY